MSITFPYTPRRSLPLPYSLKEGPSADLCEGLCHSHDLHVDLGKVSGLSYIPKEDLWAALISQEKGAVQTLLEVPALPLYLKEGFLSFPYTPKEGTSADLHKDPCPSQELHEGLWRILGLPLHSKGRSLTFLLPKTLQREWTFP